MDVASKAQKLLGYHLKVTLIDPKDYMEISWLNFRAMFDASMTEQCTISYADIFAKLGDDADATHMWVHIQSVVERVDEAAKTAQLANGDQLEYDILVMATGSVTHEPILSASEPERAKRNDQLQAYGARLCDASDVVVVGGGPIGVEVAGDVKYFAKQKGDTDVNVTLIEKADRLLPFFTERTSRLVEKQLTGAGVTVKTGCVLKEGDEGWKIVDNKMGDEEIVKTDIVFMSTGVRPGASDLLDNAVNGWVQCDEYGRVVDQEAVLKEWAGKEIRALEGEKDAALQKRLDMVN